MAAIPILRVIFAMAAMSHTGKTCEKTTFCNLYPSVGKIQLA